MHLMTTAIAATWFVILAGAWFGWQLLRQNGRLLLQLEELERRLDEFERGESAEPKGLVIGSPAPDLSLPDLTGQTRSLADFHGTSILLIFFNPTCGFCHDLLPRLKEKEEGDDLAVLIISTGGVEANRAMFNKHNLACPVLLQEGAEVAELYLANGTPSGYLLSPEGKICSGLALGAEALLEIAAETRPGGRGKALPSQAGSSNGKAPSQPNSPVAAYDKDTRTSRFANRSLARSKIKRDGLKAGTPAPEFQLPRLDGRGEVWLSELRGRQVLLVFSSPGCGPCNELAPHLEKFHREHPELEVVMISKGDPKENRAKVKEHGLTFPIVLQQQWEISRRYAMFATPVAYVIDEQGIIARAVAVGVEPILALMASIAPRKEAEPLLTP